MRRYSRSPHIRRLSTSSHTVLFGTPLWRADGVLDRATTTALARAVRQAFFRSHVPLSESARAAYEHEGAGRGVGDPLASAANNEFYAAQLKSLAALPDDADSLVPASFARLGAFGELARQLRAQATSYLRDALALAPADADALVGGRRLQLWASAHAENSEHPYHVHSDGVLSGVLFVDCPPGSGDFVAARAMPPREGAEYRIAPRDGTLLLFPSSLAHRIAPSACAPERPRLSISFNIEGRWDEVPAAHVHIDEELGATVERAAADAAPTPPAARPRPPPPAAAADAPPPPDIEVVEDEALENFAQMAQKLMREPGRKRPQGMPERKSRVVK